MYPHQARLAHSFSTQFQLFQHCETLQGRFKRFHLLLLPKSINMAVSPILSNPCHDGRSAQSRSSFYSSPSLQNSSNVRGLFLQEDDTCFVLSLEMPGAHGNDLDVSLVDSTLTIGGYRRSASSSSCRKRQRILRKLEIDPSAIDVDRAMARLWNGCLTLYAPKKPGKYSANTTASSIIML
jgi:HSP20 family molecular chaperone IbpA